MRDFCAARIGWPCCAGAAEAEIGHRDFLELGGAALVNRAIEAVAGSSMHLGDRLCDLIGDAKILDFLRFVFTTGTEGLLSGQSSALQHDRIKVTLAVHFRHAARQLLRVAAHHAGLIFELASLARAALQADREGAEKRTRRARSFEHDADRLIVATREAVGRRPDYDVFLRLLQTADDAADELEDAVSLIGLDAMRSRAGRSKRCRSSPICWWRPRRNGSRRLAMRPGSTAPPAAPRRRIS
jgi:hypothetical protein